MPQFRHLFLLAFGLILVACGPGEVANDDSLNPDLLISGDQVPQQAIAVKTWLDAPLHNDHLPLAPYTLVFHASSENMVIGFRVKINGSQVTATAPIAFNTVGNQTLSYGEFLWTPPAPGIYLIEVFSDINPGDTLTNDGLPAVANITVGDLTDADQPVEAATEVPEPTNEPAAPMFSQSTIYWGGSCRPTQVEAQYEVQADNVFNVVMFYRLQDTAGSNSSAWTGVSMNASTDNYYIRTLTTGEIPDHTMFQSAYVYFQFVATGDDGEEILRSEVFTNYVSLMACEDIEPPTLEPPPDSGSILGSVCLDSNPINNACTNNEGWFGISVTLGVGACNSDGLASTSTSVSGAYGFAGLAPGNYCVEPQVNITPCGGVGYITVPNNTPPKRRTVTVTAGNQTIVPVFFYKLSPPC